MAKRIKKSDDSNRSALPPARVQLAQWRALRAVVDAGGYAQAAALLNKSQSAVTYAVQELERSLGVPVFELHGRKAKLTPAGAMLYRRAGHLLEDAATLEKAARELAHGGEAELRLAVNTVFPTWLLLHVLGEFGELSPMTRIDLEETVLAGSEEALLERRVDLAITYVVPPGFVGEPLLRVRFIAVAAPSHPLHQLGRPISHRDLRKHRQLVLRDSAKARLRDSGWLGSEKRWTVSNKATSIRAVTMGLGFAWFPEDVVREELANGSLKVLPLEAGGERFCDLYLVLADRDHAGPRAQQLAAMLRASVVGYAPGRLDAGPTVPRIRRGTRTHRS